MANKLVEAYTTIGEANECAWTQINQAMGGLVKILNAYRRNQQRFLRKQAMIRQEHAEIKAMLGDLQEQVAALNKRLEGREQLE